MNPPSPAELATFARAIGMDPNTKTRRLLEAWYLWNMSIAAAADAIADDQQTIKRWTEEPTVSIDAAMRELGTSKRKTLKKWYVAYWTRLYGGDDGASLAEKQWPSVILRQAISRSTLDGIKHVLDEVRRNRASAGGRARHKNTSMTISTRKRDGLDGKQQTRGR